MDAIGGAPHWRECEHGTEGGVPCRGHVRPQRLAGPGWWLVPAALALPGCGGSVKVSDSNPEIAATPMPHAQRDPTWTADEAGRPLPVFALPAPSPSAQAIYPLELPSTAPPSLGAAGRELERKLQAAGYDDLAYFASPGGFALATRMERVRRDGSPYSGPDRWATDPRGLLSLSGPVTLAAIAAALVSPDPGTYRIFVFVVTDRPVVASSGAMSSEAARQLVVRGAAALPGGFDAAPLTSGYRATALIYEFKRDAVGRPARTSSPSDLPARTQLRAAGLI